MRRERGLVGAEEPVDVGQIQPESMRGKEATYQKVFRASVYKWRRSIPHG